jgi:hypothetical protein
MFLSPKASAFTSMQITPRNRQAFTYNNVMSLKVTNNGDLSLCKFKRLVKMVHNTLNVIWKMGALIHKKQQD